MLQGASERRLLVAYQRRHNSRVQLIIRRQIRSGISGVSGGGCEIRAAVKAERVGCRGAYVWHHGHVTSGRRESKARDTQKSRNPRSGTAAENTLSRNRVVPKLPFLRNARRRVKCFGRRNAPSPSRIIPEQFIISQFTFIFFFTFIHGFFEILSYDFAQFSPISNYPLLINDPPLLPIHNSNSKFEEGKFIYFPCEWSRSPYWKVCRHELSKLD